MPKLLLSVVFILLSAFSGIAQGNKPKKTIAVVKDTTLSDSTKVISEMYLLGQQDAIKYYKGYKTAGAGTFWGSLLGGPVMGLVPAIACGSTPPHDETLMYPNPELMKDAEYSKGYKEEAHGIKKRRVWGNWEIVLLINACVLTGFFVASN